MQYNQNTMRRYPLYLLLILLLFPVKAQEKQKVEFEKLSTKELFHKGDSLDKEQAEEAMQYYEVLIGIGPENFSDSECLNYIMVCRRLTQYNYMLGSYNKAFEYALKGISMAEERGVSTFLSSLYNTCGNVLSIYDDYERANDFYNKSYQAALEQNDRSEERSVGKECRL